MGQRPFEEVIVGNAKCRVTEFSPVAGSVRYLIAMFAFNEWADQWKLIYAGGGYQLADVQAIVGRFCDSIQGYSWENEDFVLKQK